MKISFYSRLKIATVDPKKLSLTPLKCPLERFLNLKSSMQKRWELAIKVEKIPLRLTKNKTQL